jgi:hypothetical protein
VSPGIPREDDAVAVGDASILVLDQVLNGFNNGILSQVSRCDYSNNLLGFLEAV